MKGIVARLSRIQTSVISYFLGVFYHRDSRGRMVRLKFVIGYLFLYDLKTRYQYQVLFQI